MNMKRYYEEPISIVYCGHALEVLKQMPSNSVDMVMTSPPYFGLRTYKTEPIVWGDNHCEHEWGFDLPEHHPGQVEQTKWKNATAAGAGQTAKSGSFCLKCHAWKGELGLEPTIELYIEHLILIFNEVKRVLKKTGTCFVNLDDSYAGGKGQSGCGKRVWPRIGGGRTPHDRRGPQGPPLTRRRRPAPLPGDPHRPLRAGPHRAARAIRRLSRRGRRIPIRQVDAARTALPERSHVHAGHRCRPGHLPDLGVPQRL